MIVGTVELPAYVRGAFFKHLGRCDCTLIFSVFRFSEISYMIEYSYYEYPGEPRAHHTKGKQVVDGELNPKIVRFLRYHSDIHLG